MNSASPAPPSSVTDTWAYSPWLHQQPPPDNNRSLNLNNHNHNHNHNHNPNHQQQQQQQQQQQRLPRQPHQAQRLPPHTVRALEASDFLRADSTPLGSEKPRILSDQLHQPRRPFYPQQAKPVPRHQTPYPRPVPASAVAAPASAAASTPPRRPKPAARSPPPPAPAILRQSPPPLPIHPPPAARRPPPPPPPAAPPPHAHAHPHAHVAVPAPIPSSALAHSPAYSPAFPHSPAAPEQAFQPSALPPFVARLHSRLSTVERFSKPPRPAPAPPAPPLPPPPAPPAPSAPPSIASSRAPPSIAISGPVGQPFYPRASDYARLENHPGPALDFESMGIDVIPRAHWLSRVRSCLRIMLLILSGAIVGLLAHTLSIYRGNRYLKLREGEIPMVWPAHTNLAPTIILLAIAGLNFLASVAILGLSFKRSFRRPIRSRDLYRILAGCFSVILWLAAIVASLLLDNASKASLGRYSCAHANIISNGRYQYRSVCDEQGVAVYIAVGAAFAELMTLISLAASAIISLRKQPPLPTIQIRDDKPLSPYSPNHSKPRIS